MFSLSSWAASLLLVGLSKNVLPLQNALPLLAFVGVLLLIRLGLLAPELGKVVDREVGSTGSPGLQGFIVLELVGLGLDYSRQVLDLVRQLSEVELDGRVGVGAVSALGAHHALHLLGLGVERVVPHYLGVHVTFLVFLVLASRLKHVGAHFVLLLLDLERIAVIVNQIFGIYLGVGAVSVEDLSDFAELLDLFCHGGDGVLLVGDDVLAAEEEVLDEPVEEGVAVVLVPDQWAHL
mmetsp:Transcript_14625/g.24924  ORF Transcript_14625/g.24924 Transcript_14625/m.24924 type:complete len:236 (+) Transcript_14625:22-729(+)